MFSLSGIFDDGHTLAVKVDLPQLVYFRSAEFGIPTTDPLVVTNLDRPSSSGYAFCHFVVNMDEKSKKFGDSTCVPVPPFFVNNPNISLIPAQNIQGPSTPPKQPPVSTVNRVSRVSPVSVVPVSFEHINNQEQLALKSSSSEPRENRNNSKRIASTQVCNRPTKLPRLSITKLPKTHKEKTFVDLKPSDKIPKLKQVKENKTKNDSSSKLINLNAVTSTPSASNSANRSPQELSQQPTKQSTNSDLNCKAVSPNTGVEKCQSEPLKKYCFLENDFKTFNLNNKKEDVGSEGPKVEIKVNDEVFKFERCALSHKLLNNLSDFLKKNLSEEECQIIKQNSYLLQSPEHNRSSEIKDDVSSNSKNPAHHNHNNISASKHPSTSQVSLKSQRMAVNHQQPCLSKQAVPAVQIPANNKQATSFNLSSKVHRSVKRHDLKHVSSNQHPTSMKHPMATVTQMQSVNKQINDHQQPTSSKNPMVSVTQIPSVTKPLIGLPLGGKSTVFCQSVLDVKRCSKCKVISEDDVCTTCRMSSQLKGVTVTRIEKPVTQSNVCGSEVSYTTTVCISSDEEDVENEVEPVITRVESDELVAKYLEKLNSNPRILGENTRRKDSIYKLGNCRSICIGSFNTLPVTSTEILFCMSGIRMVVNNLDMKPVIIDLHIDHIVKILAHYGESMPTIFIYTNYLAAVGIQYLLEMTETNKNYYFDPLSEDSVLKKIVLTFDVRRIDQRQLEVFLLKLPKGKYVPLTTDQFKQMVLSQMEEPIVPESVQNEVVLIRAIDKIPVTHLKIIDYRMLKVDEFLNDILIEFYLNYWYCRSLSVEDKKRSYVFSTFFYTSLTSKKARYRHDRVKNWTKNVNIFEKDFIFIPINESFHWYMAVICFPYLTGPVLIKDGTPVKTSGEDVLPTPPKLNPPEKEWYCDPNPDRDEVDGNLSEDIRYFCVNYFDKHGVDYETDVANLRLKNTRPQIKQPCILIFDSLNCNANRARVVGTLREWLLEEYRAKHNGAFRDFSRKTFKGNTVKVPQQPNSYDCGLFVLHFFEKFFECPIVDYTIPILHLENWFNVDEVTKDCQKRREVQAAIITMMKEQGCSLPRGVYLPEVDFGRDDENRQISQINKNTNPFLQKRGSNTHRQHENNQHFQHENNQHFQHENNQHFQHENNQHFQHENNQHFHNNYNEEVENVVEEEEEGGGGGGGEEEEEEMEDHGEVVDEYMVPDEGTEGYNMEDQYNHIQYVEEFPELEEPDNQPDSGVYYDGEMDENDEWPVGQPVNENVNEESDDDYISPERLNQFHHMNSNSIVVDVDDPPAGPSSCQNHPNGSLRSYTSKNLVYSNDNEGENDNDNDDDSDDDDDEEEEDEDEEDDDEICQSTNSKRLPHFHHDRQ